MLDFDTKQPIPGASIYVKTINKGTIATDSGKFSLSLPIDSYDLLCSSFGYKSASKMVYLLD
ncbi:MAG: carboxypeptidase-like regulatory domain-containing protein, partial [Bacteroidetes bacterium]|nr:carboxypeptidase-like regulatory domain-containing protein [Bacteroidota bacterium]